MTTAFVSCKIKNQVNLADGKIQTKASYYPYYAATGKGQGILFRLNIYTGKASDFAIDSFYINSKPLAFKTHQTDSSINLEADYYKASPGDVNDRIIAEHQLEPSWIIMHRHGKFTRINISRFEEINQNY